MTTTNHNHQQPSPMLNPTSSNKRLDMTKNESTSPTRRDHANSQDYYKKGSAEVATESAVTLAKIQHRLRLTKKSERLVLVLVGLPGRGKSFIARKLENFLSWRGSECKVFNVGKYRRQAAAGACAADFFDANNAAASNLRQQAASMALEDLLHWIDDFATTDGETSMRKDRIAIFDATNSTKERRDWVLKECTCNIKRAGKPTGVVFVESICDDKELLHTNLMTKVNNSPDYKGMDPEEAMADLMKRVQKYEDQYETIEDDSLSYIKIFNLSSKVLVNHIYGRMAKSIVPALMAWNIGTRPIFVCRAGQTTSEFDRLHVNSRMARSESLGSNGKAFRNALFGFMKEECLDFMRRRKEVFAPAMNTGTSISGLMNTFTKDAECKGEDWSDGDYVGTDGTTPLPFPCHIMTSTMPRARQTVNWDHYPYPVEMLSNLNPLDKGDFMGMELEEIAQRDPEWYEHLVEDPFLTRFPGGECYGDLTSRLESIVVDMEQQVGPVLVVSHVSVIQALVSYFRNSKIEECTGIEIPLNTVLKFTPAKGGGWQETSHRLLPSPCPSEVNLSEVDICSSSGNSESNIFALSPEYRVEKERKSFAAKLSPPIWGDHLKIDPAFAPLRRHNSLDGRNPPKSDRQQSVI